MRTYSVQLIVLDTTTQPPIELFKATIPAAADEVFADGAATPGFDPVLRFLNKVEQAL